jgi:adenylate cyclase
MEPEGFKRKLTAILSADVEGYSRLMGEDEISTIRTLKNYKEIMTKLIQQYRGRVVDAPGDNMLAEFASVVDAVQCAVEIQCELAECNQESSQECKMYFRIGVNLGDVVEEEDRIYGDGVNIAARMEKLCEGGGVCISGTAFEHVENKLDLEFEDLGEHEVKNIKKPVRVYRVLSCPGTAAQRVEPASVEKMAFPLPEKPSIAVLPFDNMSGDPEQDYIADGISENIISALSYIPEMFVIARNSSFTYKGKPVKVQQVSEELGVRYVLEGSVMKSENKVRITAQLIDAITGGHMWSERYDRDLKDLFSLLDEITQKIIIALQVELTDGQQASMRYGSTRNFEAWGYAVKGMGIFYKFGKEDMVRSRELFEKAVKIDPKYTAAVTMLAWTHKIDASFGYTDSKDNSIKLSAELAKKSVAMNDKNHSVHSLFSLLYLIQGNHEKAVQEGKKAIALGPNVAEAYLLFGEVLIYSGNFEEAVKMCEMAMRLHPHAPLFFLGHTLTAYYWVGRYDESLALARRLIDLGRKAGFMLGVVWGHTGSAIVKIKLDRLSEARQDADEIIKIWPWYNLDYIRSIYFYKDSANLEHWIDGLRMAGIPEHPPSQ